jgi:hypothetical protein
MYKKISCCLLMAIILTFSLVACNMGKNENSSSIDSFEPINTATDVLLTDEQNTLSSLTTSELLGFQGGNIGAGGLVCRGKDGYIYYRSESDGWKLYKAKPDGSEKTKLSNRVPGCINVLEGWVYFCDFTDDFSIYKVRTVGIDETKLVDGSCDNLYVAESGMYFDMRDRNNSPQIFYADLDGKNMIMLMPDASLMYYYKGKIYMGTGQLGVYDIKTGIEKVLFETYVPNVSVDDSGIYFWATDRGEFHRLDLDGGNDRVIIRGGDYFNYCGGNLYYEGISENKNGPCHTINCLNIATDKTVILMEEANEFFNAHGEWIGVTFKQFNEHPETINSDLLKQNEPGEIFVGYNESVGYVYVAGEYLYMRASLRESILVNGKLDCIARLDGGVTIWD